MARGKCKHESDSTDEELDYGKVKTRSSLKSKSNGSNQSRATTATTKRKTSKNSKGKGQNTILMQNGFSTSRQSVDAAVETDLLMNSNDFSSTAYESNDSRNESQTEIDEEISFKRKINDDGIHVDVINSDYHNEEDGVTLNDSHTSSVCDNEEDSDMNDEEQSDELENVGEVTGKEKAKKLLMEHPELKQLFNEILDERVEDVRRLSEAKSQEKEDAGMGNAEIQENKNDNRNAGTPSSQSPVNRKNRVLLTNKSPSDTTLYKPIFQHDAEIEHISRGVDRVVQSPNQTRTDEGKKNETNNLNRELMNKISDFVDAVRSEQRSKLVEEEQQASTSTSSQQRSQITVPGQQEARDKVEKTILDAEKFKAVVESPPGTSLTGSEIAETLHRIKLNGNSSAGKSDDDFLHLTCHVEQALVDKIERGEFIDLERLLPKDRFGRLSSDKSMEWISNEEGTFLVPKVDKANRINSFKKWEQAFRVYATIYCGANPSRAKEIWQYVSVINTAASSFIWDNVANYDYTFRQLMAFNPERSWAITYHHMWSLSMKEPLSRNHMQRGVNYYGGGGNSSLGTGQNKNSSNNNKRWTRAPDYCWAFNRGLRCKFGTNCRYIERCSFCDATNHGYNICPKVENRNTSPQQVQPKVVAQQPVSKPSSGNLIPKAVKK